MKKPNTETTAGCLQPGQRFWVEMVCDGKGQNGTVVVYPVPQNFNGNSDLIRFHYDAPVLINGEAFEFEVPDEYKWIVPGAECLYNHEQRTVASTPFFKYGDTPFFKYGDWNCYLADSHWMVGCRNIAKVEVVEVVEEPITLTLSKKDAVALQDLLCSEFGLPYAAAVLSKELKEKLK